MKSKDKTIGIILLAVLIILIAFTSVYKYLTRFTYNDAFITGNTSGNLNNKGLFCEYNGLVYFSNPYDSGSLYSMTIDEREQKKLTKDSVSYINAAGKNLYYVRNNSSSDPISSVFKGNIFGIYRINLDGSGSKTLVSDTVSFLGLSGNYLYYQNLSSGTSPILEKIKIDGKEKEEIVKEPVLPSSIDNQTLYYSGTGRDHNVYGLSVSTGFSSIIYTGNCWQPVVEDGFLYYMDMDNQYALARVDLVTLEKVLLTEERLDAFNVYKDYIYFQVNDKDHPRLCRMKTDGSIIETIAEGNFSDINVTSAYVYFKAFGTDFPIYKTPSSGTISVTTFTISDK